jgi:hypothetical protein
MIESSAILRSGATPLPTPLPSMWPGNFSAEANAAFQRALEAGMSSGRSMVIGCIASFKDGWIFRRTLAECAGVCVRTAQRAITQGKELGLLGVARAKKDEIPPGAEAPIPCGWSHRWTIGWGEAYSRAKASIARTRLARAAKAAVKAAAKNLGVSTDRPHASPAGTHPDSYGRDKAKSSAASSPRRWTAAEIDDELERLARVNAPPD